MYLQNVRTYLLKIILQQSFSYLLLTVIVSFLIVIITTSKGHRNVTSNRVVTTELPQFAIVEWTSPFTLIDRELKCPSKKNCLILNYNERHENVNIGAYMFKATKMNFSNLPLPRQPHRVLWGLYHDESPKNAPNLLYEDVLELFNFSATYSRHSDIPFPVTFAKSLNTITNKQYFVETSIKNSLLNDISPIIYLQTVCETSTERDAFVKELMKYVPIDSYGSCLNNKQTPKSWKANYLNKLYNDKILKFIARYKFMIAIESGVCDDYMTEKLWRPIHVGVVPIYFGSPTVRDWLPNNKSAILLKDYPTPKILSAYIKKLMNDDKLYEEYLEHKTKAIITNKRLEYQLTKQGHQINYFTLQTDFACLLCEKIHSMRNKTDVNVINKAHFNCPRPISAYTLAVNRYSEWFGSLGHEEVRKYFLKNIDRTQA